MLIEIDESIKSLLENEIAKYKSGNKKSLSIILNLVKRDIAKLINENELTIRLTKTIIENTLNIQIKDDTFYKWVKRNIKNDHIKKSNSNKSILSNPKETKSEEKKNKTSETNPIEILNSNIGVINNEYKKLL